MNEEVAKLIRDELLSQNNKPINYDFDLVDHLKTYTDKELSRNIYTSLYQKNGIDAIINTDIGKTKTDKINYILDNLETIVKYYLEIIPEHVFLQYKKLLDMDGEACIDLSRELGFSISFMLALKSSIFGKVYYKDDAATIYIHEDIKNIMTKFIKEKEVIKENKFNNKIYSFVKKLTYTYGILTDEEAYMMFTKCNNSKIDDDKFTKIIYGYQFVEDDFVIHNTDEEMLICNMEFYEKEDALDFYNNLSSKLNDKLTLNDINSIGDVTYFHKFKPYKELVKFIEKNFEFTKSDIENIDEFLIDDFILTSQISIDKAVSNYRKNIKDQFDLDYMEEEIILNYLKEIYQKMPKWSKRGNV